MKKRGEGQTFQKHAPNCLKQTGLKNRRPKWGETRKATLERQPENGRRDQGTRIGAGGLLYPGEEYKPARRRRLH